MAFFQTKHLRVNEVADDVADLVLDRHDSDVNFLDPTMVADIDRALDAIAKAARYRLLVFRSAKMDSFCHGVSSELIAEWKPADFAAWAERGQALCAKLVGLPIPSVAVIAGNCFDAGLELALACDYRVVVNEPATSLGLPELEWGLVPCWGTTQRLPRLCGLENSLQMLLGSAKHDARSAWLCGLADHFSEKDADEPPALLAETVKRDWSTFPKRNWRERYLESNRLGRWFLFRGAERILRTRVPAEMPAPAAMLAALRLVYQHPTMTPGLEYERQALLRVVEQPALHHLLRLLHHRETMRVQTPPGKNRVHHLGIIGAGIPGLSLLLQTVRTGHEVVLRTSDEASLGLALTQIVQVLQSEVERGSMSTVQFQKLLGAVRGTYTWTHFDKLDIVIDTTGGTLAEKQTLFQEMEKHIPATALLVANPLAFRVEELRLERSMRLLGLRIIEPWNRGSFAEIVAHAAASPAAVDRLRDWAATLEICCLTIPDRLGGLAMRVWLPALNEAGLMLREGIPIGRIDEAIRHFGMTFGPFEWMDRLGLDYLAPLVQACQPVFAGRIKLESGFGLMVEKGWLGHHTDFGFYRRGLGAKKPHRAAETLWHASQGEDARPVPVMSVKDMHHWIERRLVTLTVLEAVRCLEEEMAEHADDLDCALCLTGWASHRGGPIGYARQVGAGPFAALCAELAHQHGPRFAPFASLKEVLG